MINLYKFYGKIHILLSEIVYSTVTVTRLALNSSRSNCKSKVNRDDTFIMNSVSHSFLDSILISCQISWLPFETGAFVNSSTVQKRFEDRPF